MKTKIKYFVEYKWAKQKIENWWSNGFTDEGYSSLEEARKVIKEEAAPLKGFIFRIRKEETKVSYIK